MIPPVKRILVALLYFNKCLPAFERSLYRNLDYLSKTKLVEGAQLREVHGMAVDMARNVIVKYLLEEDFSAVIWADTDMIYPDDAFARLVGMAQAGYPIAAGLYRRGINPRHLLTEITWGEACEVDDLRAIAQGGVARVAMTAGGFSIVRREVYAALWRKSQGRLPWYCNWDITGDQGQCGEDRFFVLRAQRELDITPVVDPELHAIHWPPGVAPTPVLDNDPLLDTCREYL